MTSSQCHTCAELLLKLSGASDRLFHISSALTAAALTWEEGADPAAEEDLLLRARALRAECALIRTVLQDHRAQRHGDRLAMAS